jgi:hypothetical protein
MRHSLVSLPTAILLLVSNAAYAEDFIVDTAQTVTNGGAVLDGEDTLTVTAPGSVTTVDATALLGTGDHNTFINYGTLDTYLGSRVDGAVISHLGDYSTIVNHGTVTGYSLSNRSAVSANFGLQIEGNFGLIENTGTITYQGFRTNAMGYVGDYGRITNSGTVNSVGFNRSNHAANYTGNNGSIHNTGTLSGENGNAAKLTGNDGVIYNSGTLSSARSTTLWLRGTNGYVVNDGTVIGEFNGLDVISSNHYIENTGDITVTRGAGINESGDHGFKINHGTINVSGTSGYGISHRSGVHGTVINAGTIRANGLYASGITFQYDYGADFDFGTIINSGTITTNSGRGINNASRKTTVINSGTISTSGDGGTGIYQFRGPNTTINTGTITTAGLNAHGIHHVTWGTSNTGDTVTNSGAILAQNAYSIVMERADSTVNLMAGSTLFGDIAFGIPGSATLNFGPGLNTVVRVVGMPATITAPNNAYVVDGDTIYVMDTTGFGAADNAASFAGGQILDAVANRGTTPSLVTRGPAGGTSRWGKFVASGLYDKGSATTAAYSVYNTALVVGNEGEIGNGVFGGVTMGETSGAGGAAFDVDSTGVFGGVHWMLDRGAEMSMSAGFTRNDSSRDVANSTVIGGIETASASYNSYFLSPSITFGGAFGLEESSLRLRYLGVFSEGYAETGSVANLTVNDRMSHFLEARLELHAPLRDGALLRYGVDAQYSHAAAGNITLAGSTLSLPNANNGFAARGFLGIDLATTYQGNMVANAAIDLGLSSAGKTDAALSFALAF